MIYKRNRTKNRLVKFTSEKYGRTMEMFIVSKKLTPNLGGGKKFFLQSDDDLPQRFFSRAEQVLRL